MDKSIPYFPLNMHLSLKVSPLSPKWSEGDAHRYSAGLFTGEPEIRENSFRT